METSTFIKLIGISSLVVFLLGCQTPPPPAPVPPPEPTAPPPPPPQTRADSITCGSQYPTAAERSFSEGLCFYQNGNYVAAIKKFKSREISNAWLDLRVRALKQLAFIYCVTNDLRACHQAFYDAIQLDPQFELQPAEEGHPIWGPIYQKAKLGPPDEAPSPTKTTRKKSQRKVNNSTSQ